ncbi:bifunctional diaminohydroxyphosphoribosylaminopyrimidine deaminase/5-amino-6-(5-phosphoribosylamino)uracil reductase RibD [Asaia astilbis]|uniref:bifunctional diaminohydroxyphosphoribosylaminopyrimidine deaminase/5-amino-6-(5-phosphoribosylamino)uracil reductase RibD n=1 Tax=Asaia astilbis TaxID=610244 RepID=UPI000A028F9D|nr:bifunctional diaminohydroxyphosphoribosylaminopyrimidine deaminase/5-amino-6-(5-phosphoribosylamino)uracil reductase RibD [Asaia astilbis]
MFVPEDRPKGWDRIAVSGDFPSGVAAKEQGLTAPDISAVRRGFDAALKEASVYLGATSPNPAVGCTLLDRDGAILVSEAHHRTGTRHAEALALHRAREIGVLDRAVTALVTLEPCNHVGRTPPCSEALRDSPVSTVWVGMRDPNPVAGGGIARLRQMPEGREVFLVEECPDLAETHRACQALLAPFATRISKQRPWITVKQACDAKGSMIPPEGKTTFTSQNSLEIAHRLRRASDAIITGIGTVLADRPRFTVRHVADHEDRAPRLLVVCDRQNRLPDSWREMMIGSGYRVIVSRDLAEIPSLLGDHGVNWAMVEAGPALLDEIADQGLWDDWLTIRTSHEGPDRCSVRSHGPSPLRFILDEGVNPLPADKAAF